VNLTKKNRQRRVATPPTPFEQARDELFQQIMRCEVIGASPEHQVDWFNETMAYFAGRYPELKPADVNDLRKLGERFVQPPKAAAPADDTGAETDQIETPVVSGVAELLDEDRTASAHDTIDMRVEEGETVPA
jgi:hypothetical protein